MTLATTLMAVGIPAEQANRLGYEDRVPLDGNGTTQGSATELLATQTNVAMGTSVGDTAFRLPAEAEYFQPYFLLNTTAETALVYPPVGDTIDANAVDVPVEIEADLARVFMRVEEGRWVSMPSGEGGGGIASVVAGDGISVDNTDPDNPVVSNDGVITLSGGAGISVDVTDPQAPIVINTGVVSVTAGSNVSITGTAQNPIINATGGGGSGTVETVAVASANGLAGTSDGDPVDPVLTLSTTVTGILQGDGTAISAAATTGTGSVVLATSPSIVTPSILGTDGAPAPLSASLTDTSSVVGSAAKMWNPTYFGNPGTAVVHKLNRVMVGEATVGSTDLPMSTPDWLETLVSNTTQSSQFVSVAATGNLGVLGGSRTSDFRTWAGSASGGSQGVTGFGWNDDTGAGNPIAVGAEFRGFRMTGVTGITLGAQISAANEGTTVDITPSGGVVGGSTMALLLTNGPAPTNYDNPISAGLVLGSDSAAVMRKGLIVLADALDTSLGGGAAGIAMEMARSQSVRWLNSSDAVDAELWADANGFNFAAAARIGTNLANYITITGSATTQPVVSVDGSSTDVDLYLRAKGVGTVIAQKLDAATTSVSIAHQIRHSLSSGTAGAGIGVGQNFVIVNASAVNKIVATQEAVTTDATNGSEDADLVWKLMAAGAAAVEMARLKSTGYLFIGPTVANAGVVPAKSIATVQGSAVALSNSSTSAQNIFAAANDTLTVQAATTYRFRAKLSFNTGATSHTTAFGLGGTATLTNIEYISQATSTAANTLAAPQMRRVTAATAAVLTAASTAVTTDIWIEGLMRVNGAGTIVPQVTFSAGPTGTCETAINSFLELEPIGSNTVAAVGNWS